MVTCKPRPWPRWARCLRNAASAWCACIMRVVEWHRRIMAQVGARRAHGSRTQGGPTRVKLDGKVAIVSGGSRGIGKGIAQRLAVDGARVALTARGSEALQATARGIEAAGGSVLTLP